jgi:hypothetical protein
LTVRFISAIANAVWAATNFGDYARFRRALARPALAQSQLLNDYVQCNAGTAFGIARDFGTIENYETFARRVPLAGYDASEPWIERIRRGESNVLTRDRVTHLVPTSGTSRARKLIPFTTGLQREFNAAVGPWLVDLLCQAPGIAGGPHYWSITPAGAQPFGCSATESEPRSCGPERKYAPVRVGFDSDAAYLGGARARIVDSIMAVPAAVQSARSIEAFRYATLLSLLRCSELRLVSVWHPSFLSLLLDVLPQLWEALLKDIAQGTCLCAEDFPSGSPFGRQMKPLPARARELCGANPLNPESLWPRLAVVSCWADGPAAFAAAELKQRFPNVLIQPKGLLATEAFVTLPFGSHHPLAVTSHFFEFLDDAGRIHLTEDLEPGGAYEVVVTTGGGLWRYRLGDTVRVDGFVGKTPSLTFLGRAGNVSDRFGEKLSESFVAGILSELFEGTHPCFALLAPDEDVAGWRYTLYLEGEARPNLAQQLDLALWRNPQYAWCRKLGQLLPLRVFQISGSGYEIFAKRLAANGARIGDIKPALLSKLGGWSELFRGGYVAASEEAVALLQR